MCKLSLLQSFDRASIKNISWIQIGKSYLKQDLKNILGNYLLRKFVHLFYLLDITQQHHGSIPYTKTDQEIAHKQDATTFSITPLSMMTFSIAILSKNDTQHNGIQHKETHQKDTRYKGLICNTQHKWHSA